MYEISGISLLLFSSTKPGIGLYSLVFLPGTIIHELSHWIVAEILQVRTGEISIFPDEDHGDSNQRLGSVATESTDPFRGFLIGLAPFVSGLLILVVLGQLLSRGWDIYAWWQLILIVYGIIVVGNSMMISSSDRKSWPFIVIFFILIGILISKYYPSLITSNYPLFIGILNPLNIVLGVTAGLNLVMIGGSYATRRLIEKMTKKRIIKK
ncbi:hypothetical protein KBD75_01000 [Candidatus Woesebacteria bacterium]|nr:hypothetical protein [Candidatus Woesebacteria bacterium]